jgi:hypothetical protein
MSNFLTGLFCQHCGERLRLAARRVAGGGESGCGWLCGWGEDACLLYPVWQSVRRICRCGKET